MNWSYVAGFFDGEGSAGCYKRSGGRVGQRFINFSNTHRATLEEIHAFLGAGRIALQKTGTPTRRPCYLLYIRRIEDLRRIVPELQKRCIIKREALATVLADIDGRTGAHPNSGRVTAFGVENVRRLYWDEGLSGGAIARRIGVTPGSLTEFMQRHEIPTRPALERYQRSGRGQLAVLGPEEIRRLYWDEGLSATALGKRVGVTHSAVLFYMERHDIPRRTPTTRSPVRATAS